MSAIVYETTQPADSSTVESRIKVSAIIKILALFSFAFVLIILVVAQRWLLPSQVNQVSVTNSFGRIEYKVPYKNTLYENFGFVQEPRVALPLKTNTGYRDVVFLLDSGAVVSALPLQAAQETGVDLTKAKRITLQGFSGVPAFAYLDDITVKIAEVDYKFPAVFTESEKTTYILGRKGFFDDFSIVFDHETRTIVISRKN